MLSTNREMVFRVPCPCVTSRPCEAVGAKGCVWDPCAAAAAAAAAAVPLAHCLAGVPFICLQGFHVFHVFCCHAPSGGSLRSATMRFPSRSLGFGLHPPNLLISHMAGLLGMKGTVMLLRGARHTTRQMVTRRNLLKLLSCWIPCRAVHGCLVSQTKTRWLTVHARDFPAPNLIANVSCSTVSSGDGDVSSMDDFRRPNYLQQVRTKSALLLKRAGPAHFHWQRVIANGSPTTPLRQ